MIGAVIHYGMCAHNHPEGTWDFSRCDSDKHP